MKTSREQYGLEPEVPFFGQPYNEGGLNKLNKKTGKFTDTCMMTRIRIALLITGFVQFLKTAAATFG